MSVSNYSIFLPWTPGKSVRVGWLFGYCMTVENISHISQYNLDAYGRTARGSLMRQSVPLRIASVFTVETRVIAESLAKEQ
jgi:hypothetical protein